MAKKSAAQKSYEAHVASQQVPKRFKPWDKLPEHIKANWAGDAPKEKPKAEKPAKADKPKTTKKASKKKAAKK